HNEILRRRPDLLEVLYRPVYWSWNQQEPPGEKPYYPQPIFSMQDGKFSCRYIRGQIVNAQRFPEVPRFTPEQIEAMDLLDAVTGAIRMLLAGDAMPSRRLTPFVEPDYLALVELLRSADIAFVNLETTMRNRDEGVPGWT